MDFGPVDYNSNVPPEQYKCHTCGAHGCKLWREYQTCADYTELACCNCAGKSQEKDVSDIDEEGKIPLDPEHYGSGMRCDQIGWRVPAVPTEEGDTYWGYTSVPEAGVNWWHRLPSKPISSGFLNQLSQSLNGL